MNRGMNWVYPKRNLIYLLQFIIMKTAKITEITKVNEWKWPNGTIFYINMKLDNNEEISLWKKSKDAFKVWDTVNYEMIEENGKTKYKEVKQNNFQPRAAYNPEANNKSATIWMAMKIAFEVLYDKTNYNETIELATRIFEDAMAIYESYWKAENKSDENENDQLPF